MCTTQYQISMWNNSQRSTLHTTINQKSPLDPVRTLNQNCKFYSKIVNWVCFFSTSFLGGTEATWQVDTNGILEKFVLKNRFWRRELILWKIKSLILQFMIKNCIFSILMCLKNPYKIYENVFLNFIIGHCYFFNLFFRFLVLNSLNFQMVLLNFGIQCSGLLC